MLGTWINVIAVILGALIGMLLSRGIPKKIADALSVGVALLVVYIGIDGMLEGKNTLVLVLSLIMGAVIGTLLDLDLHLNNLAERLEKKFIKNGEKSSLAEGFITSTLLFCIGAMAIVGPLQSGLAGDHQMQIIKAILDFISAIVFASTLGVGVMLSAVSVLILQGSITLLAQFIAPYLTDYTIAEMTCVGSVLIFALGLNLLGITKIRLMNYLPAVFIPIILCLFIK